MSADPTCHRCGKPLESGSLKFYVRVAITADFDGHLAGAGGPADGPSQIDLAEALAQASALTEEELMAGVHQELAVLVCAGCRGALLRALAATGFLRESGGMVQ